MVNKNKRIWVWLHNSDVYKAVYDSMACTFVVYTEHDEVILKFIGVTDDQLIQIEYLFEKIGAKHLENRLEPFIYL